MKQSEYNIIVETGDKFIYFNTITGCIVGLNTKEHKTVQDSLVDLEKFKKDFPNIFENFCNFGFIIDKNRNEKEEILFRNKHGVFLDREYRLFINPTLDCNFRCWYCYEEHPKDKMSAEVFERIKKHIEIQSKEIFGMHLSWFGGEPLMYFDEIVYPLSLYAKNLMQEKQLTFFNSITTNGYYVNKEMTEKFKEIDMLHYQITLDGNKEKHDNVRKHYGLPTFDKICDNIILICDNIKNASITLRINFDDKTLKYGLNFLDVFPMGIRHRINIDFQRVWQTVSSEQIDSLNEELFNSTIYALNLGFKVNFWRFYTNRKFACYADKYYHLEINYDGKIYKCTAKGYKPEYEVGTLDENGIAHLNFRRLSKQFCKLNVENDLCLNCKYLPICGGNCWQNNIQSEKPICIYKKYEIPFETAIIKNYEYKQKFYEISQKRQNNT